MTKERDKIPWSYRVDPKLKDDFIRTGLSGTRATELAIKIIMGMSAGQFRRALEISESGKKIKVRLSDPDQITKDRFAVVIHDAMAEAGISFPDQGPGVSKKRV